MTIEQPSYLFLRATLRLFPNAPYTIVESLRPSWWLPQDGDEDILTDGLVVIEGQKPLRAGEEGLVRILPVVPEYWRSVQPGMELGMFDGPRVKYGVARIVEGLSTF